MDRKLGNMNENNLISVIVPAYNVEKYIAQCLESLITQTYKNIEIIVVDDGSPDKSGLIAEEYAKKDPRVRVFHTENCGVSAARNYGMQKAQGDYIAFVDSDDWINEDMYEKLLYYAHLNDLDMVKCGIKEVDDAGDGKYIISNRKTANKVFVCNGQNANHLKYYFRGVLWITPPNGIYKRSLALKVIYPEGLGYEDNYSAGMYLFYAKKIMMIDLPLYYYRINLDGASKSPNKRQLDIAVVTLKLIRDLRNHKLEDKVMIKKLNNKLAKEIFHFIRDFDKNRYRVAQINKDFYCWICKNLDIRRSVHFRYLVKKKRIEIH